MARKLPWAAPTPTSTIVEPSTSRPQKRVKTETPDEEAKPKPETKTARTETLKSDDAKPTPSPSSRRPGSHTRNLSSSPPPPGPPEITPLIEGLEADDGYMMVEDEFYATAQSFTAHLHHAEYKRLMREAREKKRNGIPIAPGNATRTVKDKLGRQALEQRQSNGVKDMMGGLLSSDREDDEELEKEEERVSDPWAGTSLAPLMRYDSSERVSLKGLEKISRATRAAQGFGPSMVRDGLRANGEESERFNGMNGESLRFFGLNGDKSTRAMAKVLGLAESSGRKENDRLPAPKLVKTEQSSLKDKSKSDTRPTKAAPKKYKSFIDSLDDFDEDMFDQTQAEAQTQTRPAKNPLSPEKPRIKREDKDNSKKKEKKDRSARYDEIPIFLA